MNRTLSKNLSCQYENLLFQIETAGAGLGLRGAKVTVHEHFDGTHELLWQQRKLTYRTMEKQVRQTPVADGKSVNARVDNAMAIRMTVHKPAPNHPWRNQPVHTSANEAHGTTLE